MTLTRWLGPRHLQAEFARFLVVGALNFVLTFAIYTGMLVVIGAHYLVALGAAWAVGTTFSYVLNFVWVFRPDSELRFRSRFVRFAVGGGFSIMLNATLLAAAVEWLGLDAFYAQFLLLPLIVGINFLAAKYWSLRRVEPTSGRST